MNSSFEIEGPAVVFSFLLDNFIFFGKQAKTGENGGRLFKTNMRKYPS